MRMFGSSRHRDIERIRTSTGGCTTASTLRRSVPRSEEWDALPRPLFQHATRGEHGSAACKVAGGVGVASEASYQQGNRSLVRWEGAPMSVEEALEKEAAIEKEVMKRWKALGAIISVGRFLHRLRFPVRTEWSWKRLGARDKKTPPRMGMNPCRGALRKVRGDCMNGCERSEMSARQRARAERKWLCRETILEVRAERAQPRREQLRWCVSRPLVDVRE